MTKYNIIIEINTNTAPENLYYNMELYKSDRNGNKTYALRPTGKIQLQKGNKTKVHESLDMADLPETSYILSLDLYRKIGSKYNKIYQEPLTAIAPLKGFLKDNKDWGLSRCFQYYETTQQTKKSQNEHIYIYQPKISSKPRIFKTKEHDIGDPLDPFTKEKVQQELKARIAKKTFPDQGSSSLCGPAAFFYALLMDRPDIYRQVVNELWESGKTKIGSLKLEPSKDCQNPTKFFKHNDDNKKEDIPKISAIDWMTLASLRDSENTFFDYQSPDNELSGITMDGSIKSWFNKIGATKEASTGFNYLLGKNLSIKDVLSLNRYIDGNHHILVLIGAGMLNYGTGSSKNHWIVWKSKLTLKNGSEITEQTALTEKVSLELFSWGEVGNQLKTDLTLEGVLDHLYGGLVFKKIP